jgi:class 3 adenylate cyclase/outer membrane biosynthesis protein TonB
MLDQANRTFICSVVFIDLVGYSKKPVTEQIRLKTSLTNNLSEAIKDIPVNDRIILDTGDGAAISFLGDPEDALFVTLSLREAMMKEAMTATMVEASGDDSVRMGINLGPVKLVKDINGHPNIIGDGINVAQRIMSFARPGQIVVSRSYYDVVSNLASEYAKLFTYEGSRTDKHVREHEIYVVGHHEGALQKAKDGMKDRASSTTPNVRKTKTGTHPATGSATVTLTIPSFVQDKKKLSMVVAGLGALVLILGILVVTKKSTNTDHLATATPPAEVKPVAPPNTGEPAKPVEVRPPESKVVLPQPPASQIPPPAPEKSDSSKADAAKAEAVKAEGSKAAKAAEAAKADAAKAAAPEKAAAPTAIPATLLFSVSPWGEIFVNGRSQGVTPPKKFIKLDPGKYKIEVRNTTFPAHVENLDLKARDEVTVRHKFQ